MLKRSVFIAVLLCTTFELMGESNGILIRAKISPGKTDEFFFKGCHFSLTIFFPDKVDGKLALHQHVQNVCRKVGQKSNPTLTLSPPLIPMKTK